MSHLAYIKCTRDATRAPLRSALVLNSVLQHDYSWNNKLEEYLGKVGLKYEDLGNMNKRAIKNKVNLITERDMEEGILHAGYVG